MTADVRLHELATQVRQYRTRPGVLFGSPHVLKEICALLGFKNDCRRGKVYVTDVKLQRLGLWRVYQEGTPPDEPGAAS